MVTMMCMLMMCVAERTNDPCIIVSHYIGMIVLRDPIPMPIVSLALYSDDPNAPGGGFDVNDLPVFWRTNLIRLWAKSGDICRVYGHRWNDNGWYGPYDSCDLIYRALHEEGDIRWCSVCDKVEVRGDWKEYKP